MTACLLYAPLNEFFERIPLGRILNRFTKDQGCIDDEIYLVYAIFTITIMNIASLIIMNIYSSTPFIILPIMIYLFICFRIYGFF